MGIHDVNALTLSLSTVDAALPTCVDVEQSLIGLLMVHNRAYQKVEQIVSAEHFSEEALATIYDAMGLMIGQGKDANPITIKPFVGDVEIAPGERTMQFLARLAADALPPNSAVSCAEIIRDHHARRTMILSARGMIQEAMNPSLTKTLPDLLREHEDRVERLRPQVGGKRTGFRSMSRVADDTYKRIQTEWADTSPKRRLLTGFTALDDKIGGLSAPDLIVIAGRPSMGKTALAVDIAYNAAQQMIEFYPDPKERGVVGIFSLEMSEDQLTERLLSKHASVVGTRIKRRQLYENEMVRIYETAQDLGRLPIEIDDAGEQSITQILAKARALHRRLGLRLLVIDYVQLVKGFRSRTNESKRYEELTEITAALKGLCKELNIPIIILSQVGRQVEARENKRPNNSDLRESGSIEQDADVIIFTYRDEYYVLNERPNEGTEQFYDWEKKLRRVEGVAELIVGKTRHGSRGTVVVGWDGPHTSFLEEPPPRQIDPEEAQERAKKVALSPHGVALKDILHRLACTEGRKPSVEDLAYKPELPRAAQLIERERVRQLFREEVVADLEESKWASRLQSAADNLRRAGLTQNYVDMNGAKFIYLIELLPG